MSHSPDRPRLLENVDARVVAEYSILIVWNRNAMKTLAYGSPSCLGSIWFGAFGYWVAMIPALACCDGKLREWEVAGSDRTVIGALAGLEVTLNVSGRLEPLVVDVRKLSASDQHYLSEMLTGLAKKTNSGDKSPAEPPSADDPASKEKVERLLSTLASDPLPQSRIEAMRSLTKLRVADPSIVEAVYEAFTDDPANEVRQEAVVAFGKLPHLGDRRKVVCSLLRDMAINDNRVYRSKAAASLIVIDKDGPYARKVLARHLVSKARKSALTNRAWTHLHLRMLHDKGGDVSWAIRELLRIAREQADATIASKISFDIADQGLPTQIVNGVFYEPRDYNYQNDVLQTLRVIAPADRAFVSHLKKYSTRKLPDVSRSNQSASELLTKYRLLLRDLESADE